MCLHIIQKLDMRQYLKSQDMGEGAITIIKFEAIHYGTASKSTLSNIKLPISHNQPQALVVRWVVCGLVEKP